MQLISAKHVGLGLSALAGAAPLSLSKWAEKYFYLSAESSYVEQRWVAYPYQVAIMNAMANDEIAEVTLIKSARVGCTKIMLACIAYNAEHRARNQCIWQPTDADSDDFCKTEIDTMMRDVTVMQDVFPKFMARSKENTLKQKKFISSILHLRGGKAAKNYRRISIDTAYLDELDGFDSDIEKEGSPVELARKRTEGATYPKVICGSTPGLKGSSNIAARFAAADERFFIHVPCPHCRQEQILKFGDRETSYGFKWIGNDPLTVAYACIHCAALFTQKDYLSVWEKGRWISESGMWIDEDDKFINAKGEIVPPPRHIGIHVWTAYSPMAEWSGIVRQFLSAHEKLKSGDESELKTFYNTTLGQAWEAVVERVDEHALAARAEDYPLRQVQQGGLVLTAGVDVQDNRFEIGVWAWGRGEESWVVDHMVINANPADDRDWAKLKNYLQSYFTHVGGSRMRIEAAAIDIGGHYTHEVYAFCRANAVNKFFAVQGDSKSGQPIKGRRKPQDINYRGRIIKAGVNLWHVGTDTAKDLLFGRLNIKDVGKGYVHFSNQLDADWYNQLTAESRVLVKTSRGEKSRWEKIKNRRNEVLDCAVYAMFAAHMLDLHRYTELMWMRAEANIQQVKIEEKKQEVSKEETLPPINTFSEMVKKKRAERVRR